MTEGITALLVHENSETLTTLKGALERQGMHVLHAESQAQARRVLTGLNPAQLVFTDTQLPNGTWADVLAVAEKASQPVNVIVVSIGSANFGDLRRQVGTVSHCTLDQLIDRETEGFG
ncbi:hypothetical protein SBA2_410041 [Acidobacteriia bacterium SbA2]|nr:hypothetical protein SBA2_410041 [Acidobacteriia bacterium SbA2]